MQSCAPAWRLTVEAPVEVTQHRMPLPGSVSKSLAGRTHDTSFAAASSSTPVVHGKGLNCDGIWEKGRQGTIQHVFLGTVNILTPSCALLSAAASPCKTS